MLRGVGRNSQHFLSYSRPSSLSLPIAFRPSHSPTLPPVRLSFLPAPTLLLLLPFILDLQSSWGKDWSSKFSSSIE